jgi:Helix-turn-helix domain
MREPGWITKAEAAALLEVDERTIERRARAGRITSKGKPGFPTLYRQADVEILKQTAPGEVQTGILETVPAGNGNGHGAVASLRRPAPLSEAWFVEVLQALHGALTHGAIGPTGPTPAPTGPTPEPLLTLEETAGVLKVTLRRVRVLIRAGTLSPVKLSARAADWRIRRRDLEAL